MNHNPSNKNVRVVWSGILVESLLVVAAIGLSFLGLYDRNQPLAGIDVQQWLSGLKWGIVATLPLISFLFIFHFFPVGPLQKLKQFSSSHLKPLFAGCSVIELAIISICAGVGEELFFRWAIQGAVTNLLAGQLAVWMATVLGILIASIIFGLCHAVTLTYCVLAFFIGVYLGWTMIMTQNWIVPAVAHAVYDFVALIYLVHIQSNLDG